ncbi:hypothetical protein N657DRAFT_665405 [Parathielavia appendiculata]|uniref:DUF7136 domain-containing protein n=1 Tax=Parathielavia appendiculata TaxID=2587402 RepID=A0AAN6TVQ3_9PEZI|nr:hypothetical protein N657DRAFT_665405 [Parathielavia appendiculata]
MHSGWLWASAALATLATAVEVATRPRQFEVDIVFPHNETYKPAVTMPIVLAIQNASVAASLRDFTNETSAIVEDGEPQLLSNGTSADTILSLVGFTDVTRWIRYGWLIPPATEYTPAVDGKYLLQWSIPWLDLPPTCEKFDHMTVWGKEGGNGWQVEIHDVQEAIPECPEVGGLVQIRRPPNATNSACPPTSEILGSRQGRPCAIKVDEAAASSISSPVSSSVSSSTSDKAGVGPARTVQTALAVACEVCGLAL